MNLPGRITPCRPFIFLSCLLLTGTGLMLKAQTSPQPQSRSSLLSGSPSRSKVQAQTYARTNSPVQSLFQSQSQSLSQSLSHVQSKSHGQSGPGDADAFTVLGEHWQLSFNQVMQTQLTTDYAAGGRPLIEAQDYTASAYIESTYGPITEFNLQSHTQTVITDSIGKGVLYVIKGINPLYQLEKQVRIRVYQALPDNAYFDIVYKNHGKKILPVKGWTSQQYRLLPAKDSIPFWSFQGSSSSARADWILPLKAGFYQKNYMGMNDADYGGGIPVADLWRPDAGLAVGQSTTAPKLVSLPVSCDINDRKGSLFIRYTYKDRPLDIRPGDSLVCFETFFSVHKGDCFKPLQDYGKYLAKKGVKAAPVAPEAFEPLWCAWGYGRDFTLQEIKQTLPKVKQLGIKWVGIDDGFQQAIGDWHTRTAVFPGGDQEMKDLVKEIHREGLKASIWWAPMAVSPDSKALKQDRDLLLVQPDGAPAFITWWNAYYMAPTYTGTRQAATNAVQLFLKDWGFDGIKMDGQHLNAVPPDISGAHGLDQPDDAPSALPDYFKLIYQTAMDINPGAVMQLCPCGDCMSVFNMPYTNQFVASDPESSWQVRLKAKVYKALMPTTPYFGDHVELTDNGEDFASQFGVGAVLGTKFTYPATGDSVTDLNLLTPAREKWFKKWIGLYHKKMLSTGKYLGDLYDIGYDYPEAYAIAKSDTLYYSFYNPDFTGVITLKGLAKDKTYRVTDYFNQKELGKVTGAQPQLRASFKDFLLIEAVPD